MRHTKKWVFITLASILFSLISIASLNFYIDPLWTFNHQHKFSDNQRARKERQQKSNALYFRAKKYDTLIFGSSRITYMNQNTWGENTFNYSVSDMKPNEYIAYLDFAIKQAKQPIKRVVIGLDFFGALSYSAKISENPELILNPISTDFYKYKLLLSKDSLDYSFKNIKYSFKKHAATYNYNYFKASKEKNSLSPQEYTDAIVNDIDIYNKDRYSQDYDIHYKNIISNLIASYPNIKFIIFTTPVSSLHFKAIVSNNLYSCYERWLQENVAVFKELHHFMYQSKLTQNSYKYFQDSNHGYNSTYDCLTKEILNQNTSCPKSDIVLNEKNIISKLKQLKALNISIK